MIFPLPAAIIDLTGVSHCGLAWGDYDNDGDFDLAVAGESNTTRLTTIYKNYAIEADFEANTRPEAPTGLYASTSILNHIVELSWNASSDDQTRSGALTYDIHVWTTSQDFDVVSPMAGVSSGVRRIPAMGNTGANRFAFLTDFDPDQDYYWWVQAVDTAFAGSEWSERGVFGAIQTLTVKSFGDGSGAVTSDPAGIDCGETCSEPFARGSTANLTAMADTGSRFQWWSGGGCSGTGACTVTMDQVRTVTAVFEPVPTKTLMVTKDGEGFGTVTSAPTGIDCGSTCLAEFSVNTAVILTATPESGSSLSGWSSEHCQGNGDCRVPLTEDTLVMATFTTDYDGDGISDVVENAGPNSGDGNGDQIMDRLQNRVATFPDIIGSYVTLVTQAGALKNVRATSFPNTTVFPQDLVFPCGFFGFTITGLKNGGRALVTLLLHDSDESPAPSPTNYYRYGPTPDDTTDHWYEFLQGDTDLGAAGTRENSTTSIAGILRDGKIGDDDLSNNGSIVVSAGGPAVIESTAPKKNESGGGCFLDVWF